MVHGGVKLRRRNWPKGGRLVETAWMVCECVCGGTHSFSVKRGNWSRRGRGSRGRVNTAWFQTHLRLEPVSRAHRILPSQDINNAKWKLRVCGQIETLGLGTQAWKELPFITIITNMACARTLARTLMADLSWHVHSHFSCLSFSRWHCWILCVDKNAAIWSLHRMQLQMFCTLTTSAQWLSKYFPHPNLPKR